MVTTNGRSKWRNFLRSECTYKKLSETTVKYPAPRNNTLASKYSNLGQLLGSGAGGKVCMMTRRADGKTVAVKHFSRPRSPEDRTIRYTIQIRAEFYIGSKLRHVNIIQNLELLEEFDQWYQVMEYAPYRLFDRVTSRNMSLDEIQCSFAQICTGVAYLHASGIAHRDLKLENVVYNEQGVMKLIDFGVAAICSPKDEFGVIPTGEVGCRPYMAPELFTQEVYNPKMADVWSLGILYCCMILGHFPWKQACESDKQFARFSCASSEDSFSFGEGNKEEKSSSTVTTIEVTDRLHGFSADDSKPGIETARQRSGQSGLLEQLQEQNRELTQSMLQIVPHQRRRMSQVCRSTLVWENSVCSRSQHERNDFTKSHRHMS